MARNKVKIDNLAKLRQYTPGEDIGTFLSTQFRQITTALDNAYVDPTDLSGVNSQISSLQSAISSATNTLGFYAVCSNVISANQRITFTSYYDSGSLGALTTVSGGHLWTPNKNGKFWVEASAQFNELITGSSIQTAILNAYSQSGTLIGSTTASYSMSGVYYFGQKKPGLCAGIADLTTTNGLYISTSSISGHTLQNITLKIHRIGD